MAKTEESGIDIAENLGKTEQYIEENKKSLAIIAGAIALLIGGYLVYRYLIVAPADAEARSQMFAAEQYFENDSLYLAIEGAMQGGTKYPGFKSIADEYGMTQAGNLANYYLGLSYLYKGEYQNAINALEEYDGKDQLTPVLAAGATGDAYQELGKSEEAAKQYLSAVKQDEKNTFTAPLFLMKAGLAYENARLYNDALKMYQLIKTDYPKSAEVRDIDKYIARAQALAGN